MKATRVRITSPNGTTTELNNVSRTKIHPGGELTVVYNTDRFITIAKDYWIQISGELIEDED